MHPDVEHSQQQLNVLTRTDKPVLISNSGSFSCPRINHQNTTSARLNPFDPTTEIRHSHHAAIRCQRVAADDDQKIRTVNISNRLQQLMPQHLQARHVMRQLIHRRCRELVL